MFYLLKGDVSWILFEEYLGCHSLRKLSWATAEDHSHDFGDAWISLSDSSVSSIISYSGQEVLESGF